jgi:hypothetical protein
MKYRKKPIVIEAWLFDDEQAGEMIAQKDDVLTYCPPDSKGYEDFMIIATLEGPMTAKRGDYIIKGIQGEFYPCKPEIFEATYDPA